MGDDIGDFCDAFDAGQDAVKFNDLNQGRNAMEVIAEKKAAKKAAEEKYAKEEAEKAEKAKAKEETKEDDDEEICLGDDIGDFCDAFDAGKDAVKFNDLNQGRNAMEVIAEKKAAKAKAAAEEAAKQQ